MDRPTYGLECGAQSGDRQDQERGDRPNPGAEAVRDDNRRARNKIAPAPSMGPRNCLQRGVKRAPLAGCIRKPASPAILRAVDAAG